MHHQSTPSRLQFVKLCECGCGQPTLLADVTRHRENLVRNTPLRFIKGHSGNSGRQTKKDKGLEWLGPGRVRDTRGYILVFKPGHPYAKKATGLVYEHRLVVEARLGRYLTPKEIVHHADENKSNNADENLKVTTRADHLRHHNPLQYRWGKKAPNHNSP